jgi:DNA polymerase-3 subunit delta'
VLCAPTSDDVVITIRSRCRLVELSTPSTAAIAELLQRRDGFEPELARFAARVAQGHIGRARALARNEAVRERRQEVLRLPGRLTSLGACLTAAAKLVEAASAEAAQLTGELDVREKAELSEALGFSTKGARPRNTQAALRDLEDQQKGRVKRIQRDALDRVLTELTSFYRDVLSVQTRAGAPLINEEFAEAIGRLARDTTAEATVVKLDAILACRTALETNVAPLLAMESLMLSLAGVG